MYRVIREPRGYTKLQLATELGVSPRTIDAWRTLNILDGPSPPMGPHARYTDHHVSQCRDWLERRDNNITRADIKDLRERSRA
jgi:DNA-binding transcriptional MerR regulator